MISVCIPVYNFDVSMLVGGLLHQTQQLVEPIEIIVIDDHSEIDIAEKNKAFCIDKCNYIQLEKNIGRAKIRNHFIDFANHDHLLFLDGDSKMTKEDFLSTYIQSLKQNKESVICGGRIYQEARPQRNRMLRWKYGVKKESKPASDRIEHPYKSFMTNNFLVPKSVLKEIKFDEWLSQYGHEDTLFGYRLKQYGISIKHIDNPVLNGDIEKNEEYLKKTELGLINLVSITKFLKEDPVFMNDVSLLRFYNWLKKRNLLGIMLFIYKLKRPFIRWLLKKGYVNLLLFDFYKVGFFTCQFKKESV